MKSRVSLVNHPKVGRYPTLVSWVYAPEWLTLQEASELSGRPPEIIQKWVDQGFLTSQEEEIEGERCITVSRERLRALLDLIMDDIVWQNLNRKKRAETQDDT